jgi:uncharacterized membrane protein HdeD (DUF308 family)
MAITEEADFVIRGAGTASKTSLLVLGSALLLIGGLALWASFTTTLISVLVAGALLVVGAIFQAVLTLQSRKGIEILTHALMALLYAVAGFVLIANPIVGAISLTSVIGVFFIAGGLVRLGSALYLRYGNWGWAALSGLVTLVLGIFTMMFLPEMSFVLIGTLVSIDMIFIGTTLIGYGAALPSERSSNGMNRVDASRPAHI